MKRFLYWLVVNVIMSLLVAALVVVVCTCLRDERLAWLVAALFSPFAGG